MGIYHFQLREDLAQLQTENEILRKQVSEREEWNEKKNRYSLIQTMGSAIVLEYNEKPQHYACPNCFEKKEIQILQDQKSDKGYFNCSNCETKFLINQSKPRTIHRSHRMSRGSNGWRI